MSKNVNTNVNDKKYWTGANLVSDEELNAEIEKDPYVKQIRAELALEHARHEEQKIERDIRQRAYIQMKFACHKRKATIAGRDRQLKHYINTIRLRLAYAKLKEARKKIFN